MLQGPTAFTGMKSAGNNYTYIKRPEPKGAEYLNLMKTFITPKSDGDKNAQRAT